MEIPVLSRISGFEAEIIRLQNPSYISRFLKAQTLLTWGALIIAFIATFSSLITRINRLIVLRFQKAKSAISQPFYDSDSDDDEVIEDDDEVCSSSSEIVTDDEEDEDEDTKFESITDFRVAGLNRNFSWSDFVTGRSVVKTWDELGLGFEKASESLISLWDLNKNEITSSICGKRHVSTSPAVLVSAGYQNVAMRGSSPAVLVSAKDRNVAMRVFDPRIGCPFPQIFAEWQPITTTMKLVAGDANDDVNVSSIVVRDTRKITSPVENVTEADVETWWDSDAVIVDGNSQVCRAGSRSGSVVSRCRNAVISYLF